MDYIYNLYERLDSLKNTLGQLDVEIERNQKVVNLLNEASEEDKKKYEIDQFINTVNKQINSYKEQRETIKQMIDDTSEIISLYEKDKEKYEDILNIVLKSFGYKSNKVENEEKLEKIK